MISGEELNNYNKILEFYSEETDGGVDIAGLVAYGLYKRQKRDWIVKYRGENSGRRPSEPEISAVTGSYLTEDVRNTLRDRASDLLSRYAETYVEAVEPQIRLEAVNNETLRRASEIENAIKMNSGFWRQVGTGFIATAIWTFLVTALIAAAALLGSDVIDAWQSLTSGFK